MSYPDLDYWLIQQRHQEDIAAAERYRLAKLAMHAAKDNAPSAARPSPGWAHSFRLRRPANLAFLSLAHMLSLFGNQLLHWSCRLQTLSQALSGMENHRRANPCA